MIDRPQLSLIRENLESTHEEKPEIVDTGLQCLSLIARYHSIPIDEAQIAHEFRAESTLAVHEIRPWLHRISLSMS